MSVLSDSRILEKIYSKSLVIEPFQLENIQPSSIDLTLDSAIEVLKEGVLINPPYPSPNEMRGNYEAATICDDFVLKPGKFILAQVRETISLPNDVVGNIQNRNTWIRCGINVGLSTYINPGYKGKLPIAIHNIGDFEFKLTPGMRICQLVLTETHGVHRDYAKRKEAKYHQEEVITLPKLSEEKEFKEYVMQYGNKSDVAHLAQFLRDRIIA